MTEPVSMPSVVDLPDPDLENILHDRYREMGIKMGLKPDTILVHPLFLTRLRMMQSFRQDFYVVMDGHTGASATAPGKWRDLHLVVSTSCPSGDFQFAVTEAGIPDDFPNHH